MREKDSVFSKTILVTFPYNSTSFLGWIIVATISYTIPHWCKFFA
jgi:hypothetical protein